MLYGALGRIINHSINSVPTLLWTVCGALLVLWQRVQMWLFFYRTGADLRWMDYQCIIANSSA
jgi:hypothetical protein